MSNFFILDNQAQDIFHHHRLPYRDHNVAAISPYSPALSRQSSNTTTASTTIDPNTSTTTATTGPNPTTTTATIAPNTAITSTTIAPNTTTTTTTIAPNTTATSTTIAPNTTITSTEIPPNTSTTTTTIAPTTTTAESNNIDPITITIRQPNGLIMTFILTSRKTDANGYPTCNANSSAEITQGSQTLFKFTGCLKDRRGNTSSPKATPTPTNYYKSPLAPYTKSPAHYYRAASSAAASCGHSYASRIVYNF
ncbi:uncharacterized protein Dwil_GK25649 [Drosophila willistoni]|uniref:Uncharacterized protein n=1 Tax=Drosophila willistoni TaxID=7260 RepID=B4NEI6_DROWI|nr:uncharacterized protein Dwil_GK25649 [Drosophila willistoni]